MTIPIKSYFQIYGSFIPPCIVPKPSKTYYVDFVFDIMIASDILQINKKPSRNCKDMAKIIQKNEASLHAFYLRKLFKIYRYKTFSIKKTRLDNFYDSSRPSDTEWKKFIKMLVEKKIADEFENGEKLKFNFSDFKTKTLLPFEFIYEKIQNLTKSSGKFSDSMIRDAIFDQFKVPLGIVRNYLDDLVTDGYLYKSRIPNQTYYFLRSS